MGFVAIVTGVILIVGLLAVLWIRGDEDWRRAMRWIGMFIGAILIAVAGGILIILGLAELIQ